MRFNTNHRQTMDLSSVSVVRPGLSRDQTRIARARLAELSLKLHARGKSGWASGPSTSLRFAQDNSGN